MNQACVVTGMPEKKDRNDIWYEKIRNLRQQFSDDVDIIVSIDGNTDVKLEGVTFINHEEAEGAYPNYMLYNGWLRNTVDALEYSLKYDYCAWLESDILITNQEKFKEKFYNNQYFGCGFAKPYNFVDPAFMIVSNLDKRKELISWLKNYTHGLMERYLGKFFNGHVDFIGYRREHYEKSIVGYDYISQIFDCKDYKDFLRGQSFLTSNFM